MASAAQKKMAIVCLMPLAVGLMVIGMADASDEKPTGCIGTATDPNNYLPSHKCICSKNCACAGKCIIESADDVLACFVDCVLKNDCICNETKIMPPAGADPTPTEGTSADPTPAEGTSADTPPAEGTSAPAEAEATE